VTFLGINVETVSDHMICASTCNTKSDGVLSGGVLCISSRFVGVYESLRCFDVRCQLEMLISCYGSVC